MVDRKDPIRPASEGEDPFLARWSRRKHAAGQDAAAPDADDADDAFQPGEEAQEAGAAPPTGDTPASGEAAPVDEASLAPPETLGPDSDFSAYLSRRVSSGLRRAALRRLFSLSGFNVRDGLDDYDEDYTGFASLGDTITADMRHREEQRRARDAEAGQADAAGDQGEAEPATQADATEPGAPQASAETPASDDPGTERDDAGDDPQEDADERA